jgi:hypothetical protein
MTKIDKVLKKLSELYEFNRKIKAFELKKRANKSLKGDAAKDRRAP